VGEGFGPVETVEGARHLVVDFHHPKRSLSGVVVGGDGAVVEEAQDVGGIAAHAGGQVPGFALVDRPSALVTQARFRPGRQRRERLVQTGVVAGPDPGCGGLGDPVPAGGGCCFGRVFGVRSTPIICWVQAT